MKGGAEIKGRLLDIKTTPKARLVCYKNKIDVIPSWNAERFYTQAKGGLFTARWKIFKRKWAYKRFNTFTFTRGVRKWTIFLKKWLLNR